MAIAAVLLGILVVSISTVLPAGAANQVAGSVDNPDLDVACGLDVLWIVDASTSIEMSDATDDVKNALRASVAGLKNTGSRISVVEFSTKATLPSVGGLPGGTYIVVDDDTADDFNDLIDDYDPDGWTNWEDALRVARYFAPRPDPNIPHLVIFFTDGDPTAYVRRDETTDVEYRTKVPLSDNEIRSNVDSNTAGGPALPNSDALKSMGSHILALGVGAALQNEDSVERLVDESGPDVFRGGDGFDISTTDVVLEEDFANLEQGLRNAAFELCAPSVTVRKLYDPTPDPDTLDDAVPGVGWTIEGTVTAPGGFDWVLPPDATGPTATAVTDGAGFVTFQWTPAEAGVESTIAVTEDVAANPPDPPGGPYVNVPGETSCLYRTPDTDDTPLEIDVDPAGGFTAVAPFESIVTCRLVNIAQPAPSITIEKSTNGVDADEPIGPILPVGSAVEWTYLVTNTGNTTLEDIAVVDTVDLPAPGSGPAVACPATMLAPAGSMTCTAEGVAGPGQYANTAEVTGVDGYGTEVSDSDPSHYFGEDSSIALVKYTNGEDANTAPGPLIAEGGDVTWTYEVTNPGNTPVSNVVLVDDAGTPGDPSDDFNPSFTGGDTNGNSLLDVDETWLYETEGVATSGQYANFALVTGLSATQETVRANDPSHYFGVASGITIEKYTNGVDADQPTGPLLRVGDDVEWTYVVTNTGNLPIADWTVTDDVTGPVTCPRTVLVPGVPVTCRATGTAEEGQYANTGTVDATDVLERPLTDSDPSHYVGILPAITLTKYTNGEDADEATGPFVPLGAPVLWTYEVTNTGTSQLTALRVIDPRLGLGQASVDCTDTTLDPGETTTCATDGVADVGQYVNFAVAVALDQFRRPVASMDPSHYFGAESAIAVVKYTNGLDANEPPGPNVPAGEEVVWTYKVINTGNDPLTDIELSDDVLGPVVCPQDSLAVGAEMMCTATGTAERGQYANIATVTATDAAGATVTADDPSHYFGYIVAIDVEKATNGEDADEPSGPEVPVGAPVTWTYVVTNPGDVPLEEVTVSDDRGVTPVFQEGDTDGDEMLDPEETWTYRATGTAERGQYVNVATAVGSQVLEAETTMVEDTDPSHYLGIDPGTAALGDRVWLDSDGDGIQDDGEQGISGARITVSAGDGASTGSTGSSQATAVPVTVSTGTDGRYEVSDLEAGSYLVTLDLSSVGDELDLTTPGSVAVELAIGETFLDADFGLVAVEPELPRTGSDLDRLTWFGTILALVGSLTVVLVRRGFRVLPTRRSDGEVQVHDSGS